MITQREISRLLGNVRDDINWVRGKGFSVENDNEDAIESSPNLEANVEEYTCSNCNGSIVGFCPRQYSGRRKEKTGLINECKDNKSLCSTHFLPMEWINRTVIPRNE